MSQITREQNPYNPQNSQGDSNSTDCADITLRVSAATDTSKRDARLRNFCALVCSYGINEGIYLDWYLITERLSESTREAVMSGQHVQADRQRLAQEHAQKMIIARGIVPAGWTRVVICEHCGPVWASLNTSPEVSTCLWCKLRQQKGWIPRPRVKCGECRHFRADYINPVGGLGSCDDGHDTKQLCSPSTRRPCPSWRNKMHKNAE